jgi:hypothetical protein
MKSRTILLSSVGLAIVLMMGCGSDSVDGRPLQSKSTTVGSAKSLEKPLAAPADARQAKREIREALVKFDDPDRACLQFTDRFLLLNYGARGEKGVQKCEKEREQTEPASIKSVRFLVVKRRSAQVLVVDSRKVRAKLNFIFVDTRWLINSADIVDEGPVR